MKRLVIVESPTKARTIGRILGSEYAVYSSMGHVIDLPARSMGVDVDNNFNPTYVVIKGKKKMLTQLKKEAKGTDIVYLATDPDREGEAISWHLRQHLEVKKTNGQQFVRVAFHEITSAAIKEAFEHPGSIDQHKVNAQQARRVLDRVVGYLLSPFLWKKVAKGLSAGRVQSVALRLVVERDREIEAFIPQEYWKLTATLQRQKYQNDIFSAELDKRDAEKISVVNQQEAAAIVADLRQETYIVSKVNKKEKRRNPAAPFITSTLQQAAFNTLKFTARKTMMIAQQLYEGIELGAEGPSGLITYMRTDSVKIADTALAQIREFISHAYGLTYLPEKPNSYKSKKSAQEAHEAIRPTFVTHTPEQVQQFLSEDQYKLYMLIWRRTVASQMAAARFLTCAVDITAGRYGLVANGLQMLFDGFLRIYDDDGRDTDQALPELLEGELLQLKDLAPSQHFTRPPARYSEASLVKVLEEKGIGRPSTYAPIIYTLVLRNYVLREKGYLASSELGMKVNDILVKYFPTIIDVTFTASMEEELDKVEEGAQNWVTILTDFYAPFKKQLDFAQADLQKEVITTDQTCEKCGRPMVIKWSRTGKFLSCSGFPECRFARSLMTGVKCPQPGCAGELVPRRSRRGMRFYGCSKYPQCTFVSTKLPSAESQTHADAAAPGSEPAVSDDTSASV